MRGKGGARLADAARVDVDHGGAAAELARYGGNQLGGANRRGVDANFLGAGLDQLGGVLQRADAAPDRERHEDLFRNAPHHLEQDLPALMAGADVEEDQLVGPLFLVAAGDLNGVAGVAEVQEVDALDDAPAVHVQTGDDALGEHAISGSRRPAAARTQARGRSGLRRMFPIYGHFRARSTVRVRRQ